MFIILQIIKKNNLFIIFFAIFVFIYLVISVFKIITTSAPDFPSYYYATKDLLAHMNPYTDKNITNIFIYPAVTSLIYLPFIIMPFSFAQGLFVILNASSVPVIVYISLRLIYKKFYWRNFLVIISLVFISFPTKFTLGMGQVNLLALMLLILGYYFYKTNKIFISSIFVAISLLAKPILAIVFFVFLFKKAWRLCLFIIINLTVFFIISFVLYGIKNELYYFQNIVPDLLSGTAGRDVYYNQGIMGFVSRLTSNSIIISLFSFIFGAFTIGYGIYLILKKKIGSNMLFAIFLTILPIVHTLSWQHYFVVLIFPFILAAKITIERKKINLLILLSISYLLISANIKNPFLLSTFPANLLLSHTFYGGMLLLLTLFILSKYREK